MQPRPSYLGGRLDRLLRRQLGEALAPHGLTLAEYTALSVLATRSGLSNAQLARRALITPQSMNEVLGRLAGRGLIARAADPRHGRVIRTELTDAGRHVLRAADRSVDAVEARMLAGLDPGAQSRLADGLRACVEGLSPPRTRVD